MVGPLIKVQRALGREARARARVCRLPTSKSIGRDLSQRASGARAHEVKRMGPHINPRKDFEAYGVGDPLVRL